MAAAGAPGPGSGLQLPTFATACALVKPGSCLSVGPHRRHVALSPRFLDRKRSGLRQQLDQELLRYSESLRGVPVAYDNLRIVGELGDIYDDQGHIHLNIEADFVVFCPERGQKLLGKVNKVAPSHLGCLVHGCFNASIPKPEHMAAEQWQGLHFNVGDELEFEVSRLDSDAAGVFCIRGLLLLNSLPPKGSGDMSSEAEPGAEGEKPKKSKKGLKQSCSAGGDPPAAAPSDEAEATETDAPPQEAEEELCEEQEPRTKKKKKKHHREKQEPLELDPQCQASDSSGYQSDPQKKKKKRKKPSDESEDAVALEEEPRPKKKKKKKEKE